MNDTTKIADRYYRVEADTRKRTTQALITADIQGLVKEVRNFLNYHDADALVEIQAWKSDNAGHDQQAATLRIHANIFHDAIVDCAVRLGAITYGLVATRTNGD